MAPANFHDSEYGSFDGGEGGVGGVTTSRVQKEIKIKLVSY